MKNSLQKRKEEQEQLSTWVTLSKNIYQIYMNLAKIEMDDNKKEYQKNLEYLTLAREMENKIYHSLKINLNNYTRIVEEITVLVKNTDLSSEEKFYVSERIIQYLLSPEFINPLLSSNKTSYLRENENVFAIDVQYTISYIKQMLSITNKYIQFSLSKDEKNILIKFKYQELFRNKIFDEYFRNNNLLEEKKDERYVCKLFKQDEQLVHQRFVYHTAGELNECLSEILKPSFSENLESTLLSKVKLEILFSLLTDQEFFNIYLNIYQTILDNPDYTTNVNLTDSLNYLATTISNFCETKDRLMKRKK